MSDYKKYFAERYRAMLLEKDFDISKETMDGIKQWKESETEPDGLSSLEDLSQDGVETLEVVDPEVWEDDDLKDSYLGDVILQCEACKELVVMDKSKVYVDEEKGVISPDILCPKCNSDLGFTVIGKVAKFDEPEEEKLEFPEEPAEIEVEDEIEEVEESLQDKIRKENLEEACKKDESCEELEEEKVCPKCGKDPCVCEACKDESLTEGIENLSLDTEDIHMEMTSDDEGKVTVVTEPLKEEITDEIPETAVPGEESIVPLDLGDVDEIEDNLSPEEQEEILASEEEVKEPVGVEEEPEEEETEFEVEEESFNYLGNTFAKKLYENVASYKMTGASENNGELMIEGLITFNSGKSKPTTFTFTEARETKSGRIVLEGMNPTFFSDKAFKLRGKLTEGKFISESLRYNYSINRLNESTGTTEPISVRGIVRGK